MTPTRCIPVSAVADQLGVSVDAVYDLIERGHLPGVKVGRRVTVATTAVETFIATGGARS